MKLNRILLIGIFSGLAFSSCKNSNEAEGEYGVEETVDSDSVELKDTGEGENSVAVLIRENGNLTTFSENLEKNEFQQNWGSSGKGSLTGEAASGQTGGSENQTATGREGQASSQQGQQNQTSAQQAQQTGATNAEQAQQPDVNTGDTYMQGYTIFAPSDDAFDRLPEDQRKAILESNNREANLASINYLMVDQRLPQDQLKEQIKSANGSYPLQTMQGEKITASLNGEIIVLKDSKGNEARVVEANDKASDGVLYIIDGVLMPGDLSKNAAKNRSRNMDK